MRKHTLLSAFLWLSMSLSLLGADPVPTFTFVSYNLKNWLMMDRSFPGATKKGPDKPKPAKEKARVIETIQAINPDVLGLCEIGTEADLAEVQSLLKAAGVDLPHSTYAHGVDPVRRLAMLSRFPIVATNHQQDLGYKLNDKNFSVNRGFLDATLQIAPDFQLRCVGVHLKSQRDVVEASQEDMRLNEATLLRHHIAVTLGGHPEIKLLAYGDFNDDPKSRTLQTAQGSKLEPATWLDDVFMRDANGEVWTHFWDWEDSYSRLDYCLVSAALHPFVKARDCHIYTDRKFYEASDHRPLVIKIALESTKKK